MGVAPKNRLPIHRNMNMSATTSAIAPNNRGSSSVVAPAVSCGRWIVGTDRAHRKCRIGSFVALSVSDAAARAPGAASATSADDSPPAHFEASGNRGRQAPPTTSRANACGINSINRERGNDRRRRPGRALCPKRKSREDAKTRRKTLKKVARTEKSLHQSRHIAAIPNRKGDRLADLSVLSSLRVLLRAFSALRGSSCHLTAPHPLRRPMISIDLCTPKIVVEYKDLSACHQPIVGRTRRPDPRPVCPTPRPIPRRASERLRPARGNAA